MSEEVRGLSLAVTVERLRLELEALRRTARVEQAKGVLAERLGCGVEDAYSHLLELAAGASVEVPVAAGLLVGAPIPEDPPEDLRDAFDPAAYLSADDPAHGPAREPARGPAGEAWALLDIAQCPAALLTPLRDAAGLITDFHVDAVNADATDQPGDLTGDLVGRRLLESCPGLASADPPDTPSLLAEYVRVVETGVPLRRGPRRYAGFGRGRALPPTVSVRACRIGERLLVSWRFHQDPRGDDLPTRLDRLEQAQRLGNLGWSEWDLATGEGHWSDQLYLIFGRDRSLGPLPLAGLAEVVHPGDAAQAEHLMRSLLIRREPVEMELRIKVQRKGHEVVRHVRTMAEPVLDAAGEPILLRCVFQDVTSRRRAERMLADSRRELERSRRRVAEERHIALELQRAILPLPRRPVELPGLQVAVRYLPAESAARVGGDWYEAAELPAGEVFLAIGDVSGHGLPAAATMAELRNAQSGLAFTGARPDRLLGWLNRLLLHRRQAVTASGIAALFDPATRTLSWAQAGHLPPVLLRSGGAELVTPPEGILLGAMDEPAFEPATLGLLSGDLLVLYTDGLVERRRRDLGRGLELLVEAAAGLAKGEPDPDAVLDGLLDALGTPNPDDDTCLIAVRIR